MFTRKTRSWKSHDYHDVIIFEKLRFRDGLVWTVGLTVETRLFKFAPVQCGQGVSLTVIVTVKKLSVRIISNALMKIDLKST